MRIAMLLHKDVANDTRVRREATALTGAGHEVTVVHLPARGSATVPQELPFGLVPATLRHGRERLPRAVRLGVEALRIAAAASATRADAIHAHDAAMLLPGLLAARRTGARLVYDSHELATDVPYRGGTWPRLVAAVERLGAPRADALVTVSDGIAARLRERYRLRGMPVVVRNVCDLPPPNAARVPDLRRELGIGSSPLLLHQGAVAAGRGCEALVEALASVAGAHLLFLGAEGPYAERLGVHARERGVADRVHLVGPVAPEALLSHTAQADVGVSLLEDSCENHRLALPNKLFEYIAAGLPVVVSDLPEIAALVRRWGIGWYANPAEPEGVATALRVAIARRGDEGIGRRVRRAAADLSWERERQRLLALYAGLARRAPARAGTAP